MSEKKTFIVFPPVDYEHGVVAVKQKSKRAKKRAAQRKNKQIRQKSETEADCEQKIEVRTKLKSKINKRCSDVKIRDIFSKMDSGLVQKIMKVIESNPNMIRELQTLSKT